VTTDIASAGEPMIGWRLRELAEPERWNPTLIANQTGLAYTTVLDIWHNKSQRASLATLAKLARLLNVQPGDLIGRIELERPASRRQARPIPKE